LIFRDRNPFVFFFGCMLIVFILMIIKTFVERSRYSFESANSDYMSDERTARKVPTKKK